MSYQPQPMPTPMPPQKRRHRVGNTFTVLGALAALGIIGGAAGCGGSSAPPSGNGLNSSIAAANASVRASRSAQAAAATPDPKGTYTGSCDYTLGDNPAGNPGTAVATGEVDVVNTGNIGTVDTVTITWPQEGYAPLAMHATVKIAAGATLPVPFHMPLTSAQVDNLQGYQLGHPGEDGCTYGATITDTYGVTS